jgi:hypothetical protein
VAAEDWREDRTAEDVESAVVDGVRAHGDGAVVVLHTWPRPTGQALPAILQRLREARFGFATVAEVRRG